MLWQALETLDYYWHRTAKALVRMTQHAKRKKDI